ncbi:MAG TPA: ATP-binding cassette domain-containing protein [Thermoanaerobaculia bacterium]|nr:ATP-binding cassette domain-containing protein [Thermoanaerobaculia bacterium]
MLDVVLRSVTFRHRDGFTLREVDHMFRGSTHTAVVGPPACGSTTLLRLIAGTLVPQSGDIIFGQRRVNDVRAAKRPLVDARVEAPGRWSVQHALVAAVRSRTLDREDRHLEYSLAAEKWELVPMLERRIDTLSATEAARVQCARLELMRPAIVVADRVLERVSASARTKLADALHRTLRVHGTTVISVPSSHQELAFADFVLVLDGGAIVQGGAPAEVFTRPVDDAAAVATGEADEIPITIRGGEVESVIGSWRVDPPPFQGDGVAVVRPGDFAPAAKGEDSDFVFGVEEAGFAGGRWLARGVLSGGVTLRVELPSDTVIHKGRLLAMRYDPARFTLLPRERTPLPATVPTDVVPPMRDTR